MKVEIIGRLHEVQEPVTSASGFTKQIIVIETESRYDKYVPVELVKDNVGKMDGIEVGTRVRLDAYIGGFEWNGRYFPSIKFAALTGVQRDLNQDQAAPAQVHTAAAAPAPQKAVAPKAKQTHMEVDRGDDLPF
jgi:hypothetical protein